MKSIILKGLATLLLAVAAFSLVSIVFGILTEPTQSNPFKLLFFLLSNPSVVSNNPIATSGVFGQVVVQIAIVAIFFFAGLWLWRRARPRIQDADDLTN